MKPLRPLLLATLLAATAPALHALPGQMPPGVAWQAVQDEADIERAFAQAREQHKPLLLYWGAVWCPPCNQLKATLFNRQDFIARSQGVLPLYLDGDAPGAQRLAARFKVRGYPTMVLLGEQGQEITRLPGEVDAPQYLRALQGALAGGRPIAQVLGPPAPADAIKPLRLMVNFTFAADGSQIARGFVALDRPINPGLAEQITRCAHSAMQPLTISPANNSIYIETLFQLP